MPKDRRALTIKAIEAYWAGVDLRSAYKGAGLSPSEFWPSLKKWPDLDQIYRECRKARGHEALDQSIMIMNRVLDPLDSIDPRRARVASEIGDMLARRYVPEEYSERVQVDQRVVVDIRAALEAARARVRLPYDTSRAVDAVIVDAARLAVGARPAQLSVEEDASVEVVDIFAD